MLNKQCFSSYLISHKIVTIIFVISIVNIVHKLLSRMYHLEWNIFQHHLYFTLILNFQGLRKTRKGKI